MIRYAVLVLTLASASLAHAATWVDMGGNDAVSVYVDSESIVPMGGRIKSWLKWEWVKPVDVPFSKPIKKYQLEKQLQISDCAAEKLAVVQRIMYAGLDGDTVVETSTVQERVWRFTDAVPDTMGEIVLRYVCKAVADKAAAEKAAAEKAAAGTPK